MTTNCYFSYTYNLSRSLQENTLTPETDWDGRWVWNRFLMEPLLSRDCSPSFLLPIIHGFIGQVTVSLPGTRLAILLIARRSTKYAGTRFLKRGANLSGYVANEVETEQIVWEWNSSPVPLNGKFTSFVQLRGSVPLIWSQDPANRPPVVMGKPPPIHLDLTDPFAQISALHFCDLQHKYESPVVAINLCKRRERRAHESVLNEEYKTSISYLNQFLPPSQNILYLSFDMARCNKSAGNVLPKLEEIAYNVVCLHGWFQSFPSLHFLEVRKSPLRSELNLRHSEDGQRALQSGVSRTNCIDCLDRTNVAQFVIGKVALAFQLHSMGLLPEPVLPLQTEICRTLESLYEEHGDALALQYAGSHLVHSVRTYKKTAILQERSRDVIQTLSRYYSNTFADYDKQSALNLFLGVYKPLSSLPHLWDLTTDYYLHSSYGRPPLDYCAWFLPSPGRELAVFAPHKRLPHPMHLDAFDIYYKTFELTNLDNLFKKCSSFKNVNLNNLADEYAAVGVLKLWKRQTDYTPPNLQKGKEGSGKGEGGESSSDDEEEEGTSDTEVLYSAQWNYAASTTTMLERERRRAAEKAGMECKTLLPTMQEVYGTDVRQPSPSDLRTYTHYAKLGLKPEAEDLELLKKLHWRPREKWMCVDFQKLPPVSLFTNDSTFGVELPSVSGAALAKYKEAVGWGRGEEKEMEKMEFSKYKTYINWENIPSSIHHTPPLYYTC